MGYKVIKKQVLVFAILLIATFSANALNPLNDETWKLLDSAKKEFSKDEFGSALTLCEKSRETYEMYIDYCVDELETSLSSREVKKAGDAITDVRSALLKRNENSSIEILDSILGNHPSTSFGNSMNALMSWLKEKKAFPEADFLMGKIYEAEGERAIALSFYESAWTHREYLDIPSEKITIAYRMADLSKYTGKTGDQEKYLLLVLADDSLYGMPGSESPTLLAMMRTLENDTTTDKFFTLYRYDNPVSLKACSDLAMLYLSDNRTDRAFAPAVVASIISVSMLSSAVSARDFEYVYSTIEDLMVRVGKNREISAYARENKLWDPFYLLALTLRERGHEKLAVFLLNELIRSCPDITITKKARDEVLLSR